jgi:hypothetical protein
MKLCWINNIKNPKQLLSKVRILILVVDMDILQEEALINIGFWIWQGVEYTECNAKWRLLKKLTCKGTLQQVFICLGHRTPYPPLTYCERTCKQCTYYYSHSEGGRGEELNQRGGGGEATVSQSWVEKPTWLTVSPVYKHLPQSPFTGKFFWWRYFALVTLKLISPCGRVYTVRRILFLGLKLNLSVCIIRNLF